MEEQKKNIMTNIMATRKGKTTIIASHRISQVKDLDEIIVFDKGRILERGTHDELLNKGKWYFEQYKNQIARSRFDEE